MKAVNVCVTEFEFYKAEAVFLAAEAFGLRCLPVPASEEALARAIAEHGARHAIVGVERYVGPLYAALPRGGVLARFGVGHDGIDKPRATAAGLLCINTPGTLDDSVAEHTLALMLAAARHVADAASACGRGEWAPRMGFELRGKVLAVIGCGPIGCRVAQIAAHGFGLRVTGCEIRVLDESALRREFGFERITGDFADAVRGADIVSLHLPLVVATRHFLASERLAWMKPSAWLVNTARGGLVDEAALFDALSAGRLGGAALDVFEREPYAPAEAGRDLRRLPNVLLTPHVGSSTHEACERVAQRCLHNIALAEAGRVAELDLLNPEGVRR